MTPVHATIENVSRRGFLKGILATSGLVVAAEFLPTRAFAAYATGAAKMAGAVVSDPHVFVAIDPGGIVTIVAHRAEMGTGSRTSLPMAVADELEALGQIAVAQRYRRAPSQRDVGHRFRDRFRGHLSCKNGPGYAYI